MKKYQTSYLPTFANALFIQKAQIWSILVCLAHMP